ncbi:putative transcriptional regulator [Metallosphaera yellowstonensis MK1]|uniref:Putative transcriptional regulator n=1 Tax=Metallosphaera yellowstonensis MK1 TaxID=671065 RepID=H2C775_9CREN|nr:winged helix-turn-helix domain-containing protein [Metallosphaera yellowstonensis]EHP68001.1 putative transcriptional regulator [Metallosphaera yellowstonensis MK1]
MGSDKKRGKMDIYCDILRVCESGSNKTRIMYKANLSYELLKRYMWELESSGLIIVSGKTVRLTEKGKRVLLLIARAKSIRKELEEVEHTISEYVGKDVEKIKATSNYG